MKRIETTGKTVDVAVDNALAQLGLTKDQVEIEVISEGGILKQAKVAVTPILNDQQKLQQFLEQIITKMGYDNFAVNVTASDDCLIADIINTSSEDVNLIGYRGEVLDSLQYLASLIVDVDKDKYKRIVVDSEGYRGRREKTLVNLAKNLEQKVKRTGVAAKLEPMNPYERRIIHTALQSSKYVTTASDGLGNGRHIVVSPQLGGDILNAPQRKSLNFVYRSDKKRRK